MADTTPYVEKKPGELIRAEDWNAIQRRAREELHSHRHTRGETGASLSYSSLTDVPTAFPAAPHQHSPAELGLGELRQSLVVRLAARVTGLDLGGAGNAVPLEGTVLVNTIPGASFNNATRQMTLPGGIYLMIFTYDAGAPQARGQPTWSSYFFDFPNQRLHSTAVHNPGGTSNHGGTLMYTAVLSQPTPVTFHLGRGQSGNYGGPIDLVGAQLTILHLGEVSATTQPRPVSAPQPTSAGQGGTGQVPSSTAAPAPTAAPGAAGPGQPAPSYAEVVLADQPQAYWKLDETSGTTVHDASGNHHDGTVHGGVTLGRAGAVAGSHAAAFDGTSGYIEIATGTWGGGRELTVEAWVNGGQTSADIEAVVSALGLEFVHLQLAAATGNAYAIYTDGGYMVLHIPALEPRHTWHHLALVVAPRATRAYVDGKEVAANTTTSFTTITPTSRIRIGSGYGGGRFFAGLIDEVAIYDRALSAERIQAHVAARIPETVAIVSRLDATKVLDVPGGRTDDGTHIILWDDHKGTNQRWQVSALGNGYYRIATQLDRNKVLSVSSLENNTPLTVATWRENDDNQQWQLVTLADGYYHLASKRDATKLLYVFGGHTANGTAIVVWEAHGGNNCQWQLLPVA